MSNSPKKQKWSFFSMALAGLALVAFTAACNSPTAPPPNPTPPSQPTRPSRNWPNLAGTYTMTLSASNRCPSDFPEAMRTRTYPATISQAGGALTVWLSGHGFWPGWMGGISDFPGKISDSDEVVFQLLFWEWRGVADRELTASGLMTTTISADGLSGLVDGSLDATVANEDGRGSRLATCTAPDHRVVFSRVIALSEARFADVPAPKICTTTPAKSLIPQSL